MSMKLSYFKSFLYCCISAVLHDIPFNSAFMKKKILLNLNVWKYLCAFLTLVHFYFHPYKTEENIDFVKENYFPDFDIFM